MRLRNKKERVIDLTDIGRRNHMPVLREGESTEEDPIMIRSLNDQPSEAIDAVNFIDDNINIGHTKTQGYTPPDPEPYEDERLENEGATIHYSTTYYPASNQTITKRSMTPEKSMAERQEQYLER
jgi:hypothetical protein